MNNKLSKIIQFAQETGDKLIVTDKEGNNPVVIMPFEMYEHLIRIGKNNANVSKKSETLPKSEEVFLPEEEYFDDLALEVDVPEPVRVPRKPQKAQKPQNKKNTQAKFGSSDKKPLKLAEKQPEEEPPEEEQFYLEPVD